MNLLNKMEAVFVTLAVLGCATAAMLGAVPPPSPAANVVTMPVVIVTGKRLTAEEKLQSFRAERQANAALRAPEERG